VARVFDIRIGTACIEWFNERTFHILKGMGLQSGNYNEYVEKAKAACEAEEAAGRDYFIFDLDVECYLQYLRANLLRPSADNWLMFKTSYLSKMLSRRELSYYDFMRETLVTRVPDIRGAIEGMHNKIGEVDVPTYMQHLKGLG